MSKALAVKALDWLDHRTGYRDIIHEALFENIPGGSRWRYVWGSTLVFTFVVQMITGLFLWMCYSPSATTAWESVYYIQHEMQGGAWLRGIHHYTAQAMIVLLALHLWQVILDGAYKAPREVNFWLGLILMQIVLGLSLTGYLLPWDQKGYWATQVATNIAASVPVFGEQIQRTAVGGEEYGHQTLTRFFALHAGLLPASLMAFLAMHIYVFRRHGLHHKTPIIAPDRTFWPDQILKDGVACLGVLMIVLFLVKFVGAELGAPADPANSYSAARPEWYFLFLFEFLKLFPGEMEFVGAVVIPGAMMGLLFLMPIIGGWKLGHRFNIVLFISLLIGAVVLTCVAKYKDLKDPGYNNAVWEAQQFAQLAEHRAKDGIPAAGAASMMREEPRGVALRVVFQQCLSCHAYTDPKGVGFQPEKATAPNLYGFGRREWIAGVLDPERIGGPHYFGPTEMAKGDMVGFVQGDLKKLTPEQLDGIITVLALEAAPALAADQAKILEAKKYIEDDTSGCAQCHTYHGKGTAGSAPDLTGYGSREWLIGMIGNPNHERFYGHLGDKQKMPPFAEHPKDSPQFPQNRLSPETIGLIADWFRGSWYIHEPEAVAK